jgi:predicted transcriptional regulator
MTQLQRVFSDENCALLKAIRTLRPTSVDELAAAVGKKQSSVSRALHLMAPYGVVQLVRHGREVTPQVAFDQIVVSLL